MLPFRLEDLLDADDAPVLPPGRKSADVPAIHRRRLMAATLRTVAERGYAETTVADIVRAARVSRRTFYLHYASKDECFFAACDVATAGMLSRLGTRIRSEPARPRLIGALEAYLRGAAAQPELVRIFQIELTRAGPEGVARHRGFRLAWAGALCAEVRALRRSDPDIAAATTELDHEQAVAVVGAISAVVLRLAELPDPAGGVPAALEQLVTLVLGTVSTRAAAQSARLRSATGTISLVRTESPQLAG